MRRVSGGGGGGPPTAVHVDCCACHAGVGPMTIGMLMQNTLTNARTRLGFTEA